MKKIKLSLLAIITLFGIVFQSCNNNDDHYSLGDIAIDWATAVSISPNTYYLVGDTWGSMWPAATSIPGYKPKDGQRVVVLFNPLADNFQSYDHAIKVEDVKEVLTKKVELLTAGNNEDYGNDPITINQGEMWISGNHLNVIFIQKIPLKEKHRISLVAPSLEVDNEGYVPVQLRYNTYNDTTDLMVKGNVSFDLEQIMDIPNAKGIRLQINSSANGMRDLYFDFYEE